jgi:beta-1,2-mannobiose phosphorylase / 1,2-beta-oligomannan phosphorylase
MRFPPKRDFLEIDGMGDIRSTVRVTGEPQLLEFRRPPELANFFALSPFVVRSEHGYEMLLRLVNPSDDPAKKVSRIYHASSTDGIAFDVGPEVIAPGDWDDSDGAGCEDPTVVGNAGAYSVFYSGYNAVHNSTSMLRAAGTSLTNLTKMGLVFRPDAVHRNTKEAALVKTPNGFRMFFEYAQGGASLIGVADAARIEGPWAFGGSPLVPRPSSFDSWHLSPSSAIACADGTHILFYNGASKEAVWRIGYALLDQSGTVVLDRPEKPLIEPFGLTGDDTNIAFAASAVVEDSKNACVYYSVADRRPYSLNVSIEGADLNATE